MLRQRVITALVLVSLLGAVLFGLPWHFGVAAFGVIAALAGWDWGGLMRWPQQARIAFAVTLVVAGAALHWVAADALGMALLGAAMFWLILAPAWLSYRWSLVGRPLPGALVGIVVILPTWIAMSQLHQRGPWVLLGAMAVVWVADIAAYFAGRRFGRHKLAPNISPGKTWEGVAGAVAGVLVYFAVLYAATPLPAHWSRGLLPLAALALALTALSVAGDLFESMLKRQAGIKDSSQLLPGHGGVLDRIDALTSTLPLAALIVEAMR